MDLCQSRVFSSQQLTQVLKDLHKHVCGAGKLLHLYERSLKSYKQKPLLQHPIKANMERAGGSYIPKDIPSHSLGMGFRNKH